MTFPRRTHAQESGEIGINIVSKIVTQGLGMIFRRVPQEHDYGIDAHIDYVGHEGLVTGGSIAAQIKYGPSYFKDETPDGYWYSGSIAHMNYFLNQSIPVFILLVHPDSEDVFWVEFNPNYLHKSGENWKILVPRSNSLKTNFLERMQILCVGVDLSVDMQEHLAYKDAIAKFASAPGVTTHIMIRRESIESCDTLGLVSSFEGLRSDKQRLRQSQGKAGFFVKGYDEDPRELYEIPEVVAYFHKVEPEVKYWFYFLSTNSLIDSLQTLMTLVCNGRKGVRDGIVDFERGVQHKFFERNFGWLNEITDFIGLPIEENKKISEDVIRYYNRVFVAH